MTSEQMEIEVMAHRYLYYVLSEPVLPDAAYDLLEREARALLPSDSAVQKVGSSLPSSYSELHVARAMEHLRSFGG